MKYLKYINESITDRLSEIHEFTEIHLAYLIDEGFRVSCYRRFNKLFIDIDKGNGFYESHQFNWNDIKDHFIPFAIILEKRFGLIPYGSYIWEPFEFITHKFVTTKSAFIPIYNKISLQQIVKDNLPMDISKILRISFSINLFKVT